MFERTARSLSGTGMGAPDERCGLKASFSDIIAVTLRDRAEMIADDVMRNNALLARLRANS